MASGKQSNTVNPQPMNGGPKVEKPQSVVDHLQALRRDMQATHSQNMARLEYLIALAGRKS